MAKTVECGAQYIRLDTDDDNDFSDPSGHNGLGADGRISDNDTFLDEEISRIAGGSLSFKGEFPSLVSLQVQADTGQFVHVCGGTIIDEQHVLTAAHCFLGG